MHTLYLVGGGNAAVPEGRFEAWDESRLMVRKESRCISPAISVITPERAPNSEGMKLDISFVVYLYCAIYFEMFFSFSNSIFLSSSSSLFSYIQGRLSSNIGPKGCDASSPYQNCVHLSPQTLKITFINNNICCCLFSVLYSNNLASSFTLHILVYHTCNKKHYSIVRGLCLLACAWCCMSLHLRLFALVSLLLLNTKIFAFSSPLKPTTTKSTHSMQRKATEGEGPEGYRMEPEDFGQFSKQMHEVMNTHKHT